MADSKAPVEQAAASSPVAAPVSASPPTHEPTQRSADEPLHVADEFQGRAYDDDQDSAVGDSDVESSTASVASSILQYRTINGRTYHSERSVNSDANLYWGANDAKQNHNLDLMHQTFCLLLDDKLYLAPLPEKLDKVLDIGTGTGLWCIDFGDDHPDCEVIGTDLSPIQPDWIPPNVKFEIDDYTQPWTFEDNSLDYVHLRWLVGTITDWTELFRQAYRVLKPGGWIETFEANGFYESDDGTLTDKTALSKWGYFFREGAKALGSKASFEVVKEGLQVKGLNEAGFQRITENHYKIPVSEWAKDPKYKQIGLITHAALDNDTEGVVGFMASQIGWTKEEVSVYAAHLRKELRTNAVHAYYRSNVVYAQKPLSP
ncbi:methyltransferase domain-containing protein [Sarocladium implicatum]|nr:methyltransferase domain-containing protein [Sarocladium implicatum]